MMLIIAWLVLSIIAFLAGVPLAWIICFDGGAIMGAIMFAVSTEDDW